MSLKVFIFLAITVLFLYWSRPALRNPRSHGFHRFFAWEAILALILVNAGHWFHNPFSFPQIISWLLLLGSLWEAGFGALLLIRRGEISRSRVDPQLFSAEKTTVLVTDSIYRYIRHPMYGALFLLTWGVMLKGVTVVTIILTAIASLFLYFTAKREEDENIAYFGQAYRDYMQRSRMFVPYLF